MTHYSRRERRLSAPQLLAGAIAAITIAIIDLVTWFGRGVIDGHIGMVEELCRLWQTHQARKRFVDAYVNGPQWHQVQQLPVRACRVCGCTEWSACDPACWWVAIDLCSSCQVRLAIRARVPQPRMIERPRLIEAPDAYPDSNAREAWAYGILRRPEGPPTHLTASGSQIRHFGGQILCEVELSALLSELWPAYFLDCRFNWGDDVYNFRFHRKTP